MSTEYQPVDKNQTQEDQMDYINGEAKNCSRNFLNAFQSDKGHKCPPTYHIFKKPVKSKDKIIHRWYYYFFDPVTGKKIQKVCKN